MLSKAPIVVSFRILTALLCLVTVPVACFLCVCPAFGILAKKKIYIYWKKKKKKVKKVKRKKKVEKKREPHPVPSTSGFLRVLCVFWASSDATGNNSGCDTGNSPPPCGVCVGSTSSSAVPPSPSDTGLPSRTFVTGDANQWQPPGRSVSFRAPSGAHPQTRQVSPVTSVVCDAGHDPVCIPTQRKNLSWRKSEVNIE